MSNAWQQLQTQEQGPSESQNFAQPSSSSNPSLGEIVDDDSTLNRHSPPKAAQKDGRNTRQIGHFCLLPNGRMEWVNNPYFHDDAEYHADADFEMTAPLLEGSITHENAANESDPYFYPGADAEYHADAEFQMTVTLPEGSITHENAANESGPYFHPGADAEYHADADFKMTTHLPPEGSTAIDADAAVNESGAGLTSSPRPSSSRRRRSMMANMFTKRMQNPRKEGNNNKEKEDAMFYCSGMIYCDDPTQQVQENSSFLPDYSMEEFSITLAYSAADPQQQWNNNNNQMVFVPVIPASAPAPAPTPAGIGPSVLRPMNSNPRLVQQCPIPPFHPYEKRPYRVFKNHTSNPRRQPRTLPRKGKVLEELEEDDDET